MAKKSALTVRQRTFVSEMARGATQTAAAATAGYAHPHVTGTTVLNSPTVREALDKAFADKGLDDTFLAQKVHDLCCAVDEEGNPNWVGRARGVDLLCRIKGAFRPSQVETTTISFEARLELIADVSDLSDEELTALDANLGAIPVQPG